MSLWRQRFESLIGSGEWSSNLALQWITSIISLTHIGLGVGILVGGMDRFPPPTYGPLIDLTQGHIWVWAVWIQFSGMLIITPFRWVSALGLWLGMFWHYTWAGLFAVAIYRNAESAATPVVTYLGMAMICTALLMAKVLDRGEG